MSNSRVRVGYAATHPTHETRPLRGSPCERGAYSAELQTAPNRPYVIFVDGQISRSDKYRSRNERDPTNRMPNLFRCWVTRCALTQPTELILLNCKQRLTAPTLFLLTGKSRPTFRQKETPTKVGVFNAIPLQQGQVFNEGYRSKKDGTASQSF